LRSNRIKPLFDKIEIGIFAGVLLILAASFLVTNFRVLLVDYSLLRSITLIVTVGLVLIAIAYHKDRESDWKKKQQLQAQVTCQN
jgi:hypothetical protein